MGQVTLQILDGADRGRLFEELATPVTIGREEGNSLQLNDERVSRYHLKIQEDHDKIVLTDLESTNGTKVNGEEIQLRILRYGDLISVGRSVLLYGSREQIASRLAELRAAETGGSHSTGTGSGNGHEGVEFELNLLNDKDDAVGATLHALQPPELPERMSPGQAAQLSELLEYLRLRIRGLLESVQADDKEERVTLDARQWQSLLDVQGRLAAYVREIGEPEKWEE